METELRYAEIRAESGRTLEGVAVRYGEVSRRTLAGPETIMPGAFQPLPADVILNRQHDRRTPLARTGAGLTLTDTPEALTVRARLPQTREADDTLELVRAGVLRGLSVEIRVAGERMAGGVRVIESAALVGLGVVDRPAYPGSRVEARADSAAGRALSAVVPYGKPLDCQCHKSTAKGGTCERVQFAPGTFRQSLREGGEVLAIAGRYKDAVASTRAGSLALRETRGGLEIEIPALPDTEQAANLLAMSETVPVLARPLFREGTFTERDGIAFYSLAQLYAILLGPSDRSEGWEPVELRHTAPRRPRIWL